MRDGDLVLTAKDGARIGAYGARADRVGGAGVVILPDVRGLHQFYRELAFRFAEAGIHACAIGYFGRTAGIAPRGDDFDFGPHIEQTRDAAIAMDVGAAAAGHLRSKAGGAARANSRRVGRLVRVRSSGWPFHQASRRIS